MKPDFRIKLFLFFLIAASIFGGSSKNCRAEEFEVRLTADRLTYNQSKKDITLVGNVRFITKEATLIADNAYFNTKTRVGKMDGHVSIYQKGTTITGDQMTVFYTEKRADVDGNVKIVTVQDLSTSAGSRANNLASGVTKLNCDKFVYNWDRKDGNASGNVSISQKNRRMFADQAYYSGGADVITAEGRVRFEQGSNDWVNCQRAVIDTRKETFTASGAVSGSFLINAPDSKKQKETQNTRPEDKIIIPTPPFEEKKD